MGVMGSDWRFCRVCGISVCYRIFGAFLGFLFLLGFSAYLSFALPNYSALGNDFLIPFIR